MQKFAFYLCLSVAMVSGASSAEALEIWRNQQLYDIGVKLPKGAVFTPDGIDRKFSVSGVGGNLRLIQDHYDNCEQLINERQHNRAKNGYTRVSRRKVGEKTCQVTLTNPSNDRMMTSHYVFLDVCKCFAAVHFTYGKSAVGKLDGVSDTLLSSLDQNRGSQEKSAQKLIAEVKSGGRRFGCVDSMTVGACDVVNPKTGKPFTGIVGGRITVQRKELARLGDFYNKFRRADGILRKRGASRENRKHLFLAIFLQRNTETARAAYTLYSKETFDFVYDPQDSPSQKEWESPATILRQYGFYLKNYYDPVTGRSVDRTSPEGMARGVPKCFLEGNPERDCKPLRYHWWVGCWIHPSDRAAIVKDPSLWRIDGLGDIPMLPAVNVSNPIDLSKATRKEEKRTDASQGKNKKNAIAAGNGNPAGRPACKRYDMWEESNASD